MPGVDRTPHKQIRRASGARPNVRYTSPRYQTGQQTLSAQPLIPLSDRLSYATLTRPSGQEHFMNLSQLDREINFYGPHYQFSSQSVPPRRGLSASSASDVPNKLPILGSSRSPL